MFAQKYKILEIFAEIFYFCILKKKKMKQETRNHV